MDEKNTDTTSPQQTPQESQQGNSSTGNDHQGSNSSIQINPFDVELPQELERRGDNRPCNYDEIKRKNINTKLLNRTLITYDSGQGSYCNTCNQCASLVINFFTGNCLRKSILR